MNTTLTFSAWAGLLLTAVALLIGGAATITNIRNVRGPRERRFVLFHCAAAWTAILALLVLVAVTPSPWRFLWLIPYFVHLPLAIYRYASKHQLIRVLEEREAEAAGKRGKSREKTKTPAA